MAIGIVVLLTVAQIDACRTGDGMAGTADGASVLARISNTTAGQMQPQCAIAQLLHLKARIRQLAVWTGPSDHRRLQPQSSHWYHTHHLGRFSRTHSYIPQRRHYSDGWLGWSWNTPTRRLVSVLGVVILPIRVIWIYEGDCHLSAGHVWRWTDWWWFRHSFPPFPLLWVLPLMLIPLGERWFAELHPRLLDLRLIGLDGMQRGRRRVDECLRIGRGKDDTGRHPTFSCRTVTCGCTVHQVAAEGVGWYNLKDDLIIGVLNLMNDSNIYSELNYVVWLWKLAHLHNYISL